MSIDIFFSYVHKDEILLNRLIAHLSPLQRQGLINFWFDRDINVETDWMSGTNIGLNNAQIILLLISSDFMASEYCYNIEMRRAMERHDHGEARVIPIILSPVHWETTPISKLQVLPKNAKPITEWEDREGAFNNIVANIQRVIKELKYPENKNVLSQDINTLEIYFSYSHHDELMMTKIEAYLRILERQGLIAIWHDGMISAGTEWKLEIDKHLNTSKIILLLISQDYLNSEFRYQVDLLRAMERHEHGEARVIPIILGSCDWKNTPISRLQALPKNAKPITEWEDREGAFNNIVENIRRTVNELIHPRDITVQLNRPLNALETYLCYSHKDETIAVEIEGYLRMLVRQGVISIWHHGMINAGTEWRQEIQAHLEKARIILLLVSRNFLDSDFIYHVDLQIALKKHHTNEACVIPIILSPCNWHNAPFANLEVLPMLGKPVTEWENRETIFMDIAKHIRTRINEIFDEKLHEISNTSDEKPNDFDEVEMKSSDINKNITIVADTLSKTSNISQQRVKKGFGQREDGAIFNIRRGVNMDYSYDVALSYAGEDRIYADALAEALRHRGLNVFYDKYEKSELWGKNLYAYLSSIYQDKARYCVMFLSKHYAMKLWTNHEREAAQARAFKENEEYILPIRLDNTEIPGVLPTVVYLNWHQETAEGIADMLLQKLDSIHKLQADGKETSEVNLGRENKHRNILYQLFFAELLERLRNACPGITNAKKTQPQNFYFFGAGKTGYNFNWAFTKNGIKTELLINIPNNRNETKKAFDTLYKEQATIEKELGQSLVWERLEGKESHIFLMRSATIDQSAEELEQTKKWAVETMIKFVGVFRNRIKLL